MAWFEGAAVNAAAFNEILHDSIKSVMTQVWSIGTEPNASDTGDHVFNAVYQGVGAEGQPAYIGVAYTHTATSSRNGVWFCGIQGVNPEATQLGEHLNASGFRIFTTSVSEIINYNFSVTPGRTSGVVSFGAIQQSWYAGLGLPFSLPGEYPLPMLIHGCSTISHNYTESMWYLKADFWLFGSSRGRIMTPSNAWISSDGGGYGAEWGGINLNTPVYPYGMATVAANKTDTTGQLMSPLTSTDGDYIPTVYGANFANTSNGPVLEPIVIFHKQSNAVLDTKVLFALEGWTYVIGRANPGDIITDGDGIDHIVFVSPFMPTIKVALERR